MIFFVFLKRVTVFLDKCVYVLFSYFLENIYKFILKNSFDTIVKCIFLPPPPPLYFKTIIYFAMQWNIIMHGCSTKIYNSIYAMIYHWKKNHNHSKQELIQNAEDASASEMKILYDDRPAVQDPSTKRAPFRKYFKVNVALIL